MTPLVIILILIGAGILLFSCFLIDKSNNNGDIYATLANQQELSITEMENIKNKVEAMLSEVTEDSIAKTEDKLNQISNEKIIAVNDFSNQVIEKISHNHEEVVFLYNMLNEKESEIKDTVKSIDKAKRYIADTDKKESANVKLIDNTIGNNRSVTNASIIEAGNLSVNTDTDFLNNHNQKILEMYSQGFSIIDISKTLEIGQGEVKLVIDLFQDK